MAQNLPDFPAMSMPFANNGDRNTIPDQSSSIGGASLAEGFPIATSTPIADGGVPPARGDMNALGYLSSFPLYFLAQGGFFTFSEAESNAIGGYPLGAVLHYIDTSANPPKYKFLRSAVANNTDNFITDPSVIGTSWLDVTPYADGFLPLSGGTMTGSIIIPEYLELAKGSSNKSRLILRGGTAYAGGATLALSGKDANDIPGSFGLYAHDGTNTVMLMGRPDGTLVWDGKSVERVNSSSTNYIRYENGLQMCWGLINAGTKTLPKAFKDTNYSIVISDSGSSLIIWAAGAKTTTGFTAYAYQTTGTYAQYIAIGRWK